MYICECFSILGIIKSKCNLLYDVEGMYNCVSISNIFCVNVKRGVKSTFLK